VQVVCFIIQKFVTMHGQMNLKLRGRKKATVTF